MTPGFRQAMIRCLRVHTQYCAVRQLGSASFGTMPDLQLLSFGNSSQVTPCVTGEGLCNLHTPSKVIPTRIGCQLLELQSSRQKLLLLTFKAGAVLQGALGLPSLNDAYEPEPVTMPGEAAVLTAAAGHFHSLAVSREGQLWSWG